MRRGVLKVILGIAVLATAATIMSFGLAVKSASDGTTRSRQNVYGISVIEGTGSWKYFFNGGSRTSLRGSYYSVFPIYREVELSVSSLDSFYFLKIFQNFPKY